MASKLEADYLVVGAGGMALAFVDEIVAGDPNARIIIVDRRPKPGGHWNDAYDFVRLHQPAAWYGINSLSLGTGPDDLASKREILAHFRLAMEAFCSTGRVAFYPSCNYTGQGQFVSLVDESQKWNVAAPIIVDGTYTNVSVPAMGPPSFSIDADAHLMPINALTQEVGNWEQYCVIGAGKTGMDAILYLLDNAVPPERISWIVPNDAWFLDRASFATKAMARGMVRDLRFMAIARSKAHLFELSEAAGRFLRLDPDITPTRFRCATVSKTELGKLRTIKQFIRMGRVRSITIDTIELEHGQTSTTPRTLHVDCTADGLRRMPAKPVFADGTITLQPVLLCQPLYSGALIGWTATHLTKRSQMNEVCRPVPHPAVPDDYFKTALLTIENISNTARQLRVLRAILRMRLSLYHHFSAWDRVKHLLWGLLYQYRAQRNMKRLIGTQSLSAPDATLTEQSQTGRGDQ